LATLFAQHVAALDIGKLEFEEYFVTADNVVIATGTECDSLVKSTGKHYTMPFVWVARFRVDTVNVGLVPSETTRGIKLSAVAHPVRTVGLDLDPIVEYRFTAEFRISISPPQIAGDNPLVVLCLKSGRHEEVIELYAVVVGVDSGGLAAGVS